MGKLEKLIADTASNAVQPAGDALHGLGDQVVSLLPPPLSPEVKAVLSNLSNADARHILNPVAPDVLAEMDKERDMSAKKQKLMPDRIKAQIDNPVAPDVLQEMQKEQAETAQPPAPEEQAPVPQPEDNDPGAPFGLLRNLFRSAVKQPAQQQHHDSQAAHPEAERAPFRWNDESPVPSPIFGGWKGLTEQVKADWDTNKKAEGFVKNATQAFNEAIKERAG